MKIAVLIQARMKSTRLPGKILKQINGKSLVEILINRLKRSKEIDQIIVATSTDVSNDVLVDHVNNIGVELYRGSENDVLDRFYNAVKDQSIDYIVRITSDCPLIDPVLLDDVIKQTVSRGVDYGTNCGVDNEQFPDGQDIEVFTFKALKEAWKVAKLPSEREHVTPYIMSNINSLFTATFYHASVNLGHIRMTVDTQQDFDAIDVLIMELGDDRSWSDYADYIIGNPGKFYNQDITRNEGYQKSLMEDKSYKI